MFQACNQLEIATHIEMVASMLRRDAVKLIKVALAGTKTERFVGVIEAAFVEEGVAAAIVTDPSFPAEEAEEEEEEVDLIASSSTTPTELEQPTLSKALKRKLPSPSDEPKHRVLGKRTSICLLSDATPYYPTTWDKNHYIGPSAAAGHLHSGVAENFFSARQSSAVSKEAGYFCKYIDAMRAQGKIVLDCDFFSSTKGQLSTHIRQKHLGVAVACYVCNKKAWSGKTWLTHMQNVHKELSEDEYYVKEGVTEGEVEGLAVKTEVGPEDI